MNFNQLGAWRPLLEPEIQKPYFQQLQNRIEEAYSANDPLVYPPQEDLFRAFELTRPDKVSCLILGQDPYPTRHHAHGLSFSVRDGIPHPKSLQNIFKELHDDIGYEIPTSGDLTPWANQGVLLLNSSLTVYEGQPDSHSKWGWQTFTKVVLEKTRELPQPIVYILWGNKAQKTAQDAKVGVSEFPRLLISSPHPSPLGAYRGFWGNKPFSQTNDFLIANGAEPINWFLE